MISVGSVVYLLDKKTHTVVPCQIVEQVKSTTLEGEETYHTVKTPNQKSLRLEEYPNPWFSDIDEARDFLLAAATSLIDTTIQRAKDAEEECFPQAVHPLSLTVKDKPSKKEAPETLSASPKKTRGRRSKKKVEKTEEGGITVDLGEGQTARVTLPEGMEIK